MLTVLGCNLAEKDAAQLLKKKARAGRQGERMALRGPVRESSVFIATILNPIGLEAQGEYHELKARN